MKTFGWIATVICITGTILNVKRCDLCFALWIVGEIMWTAFDIRQRFFSRMWLDLLGLVLAIWGFVENCWR